MLDSEKQQKQQKYMDLQQQQQQLQEKDRFGDAQSWIASGKQQYIHHNQFSSSSTSATSSSSSSDPGNFDRVLYRNLVEMVPLVESLMDRRANPSYSRRASLNYTRTPSRDSFSKKIADQKGRKVAQTNPSKKQRELVENDVGKKVSRDNQDACADDFSIFSSRSMAAEKDREELINLKGQLEDLQKKLLEKDEALRAAENSLSGMSSINIKFDQLKQQLSEKDSLLKSTNQQLSSAKIKLADKQASLEKLRWEAQSSSKKAEKLQEDLHSVQDEIATFMRVFKELAESDSMAYAQEKDLYFCSDQLPQIEPIDELEMKRMEEVRLEYLDAVAAAKENPSEETLAVAAEARLKLQALAFGFNNSNLCNGN